MSAATEATAIHSLRMVKIVHTLVWFFFASSILAIPVLASTAAYGYASALIALVLAEVVVLIANGWRCPLTDIAARYTDDRRDNFDIFLPAWLARHNKLIFGVLYVLGIAFTVVRWSCSSGACGNE